MLKEKLLEEKQWDSNVDGFICVSEYGTFKSEGTVSSVLKRICMDCGLPAISPHDIRHIASTFMLECLMGNDEQNADADINPILAVSEYLGHASIATTFETYVGYVRELSRVRDIVEKSVDPFSTLLKERREQIESIRTES